MALNPNALTTLARAKEELEIPVLNTEYDTQIENYINGCSDQIELETNRSFRQQSYTHRLSGNGTRWVEFEQFPVIALTGVKVDKDWVFGASSVLPVGTQTDVDKQTFLVRRGTCNEWPSDQPMNIEVEYTAGYGDGSDPETLPEGIQQACIEYVRFIYLSQGDRRSGSTSKSKLGDSGSFETGAIPFIITNLIKPYKRENVLKRAWALNGILTSGGSDGGGDS